MQVRAELTSTLAGAGQGDGCPWLGFLRDTCTMDLDTGNPARTHAPHARTSCTQTVLSLSWALVDVHTTRVDVLYLSSVS